MNVQLPALAEGIDSGTIVSILVKVGDKVNKEDSIMEVETNKAVASIPSTGSGTITQIHVKEGDNVNVGAVLISLDDAGGSQPAAAAVQAPASQPSTQAQPQSQAQPAVVTATPAAGGQLYQSASGFPPPSSPSIRKMAHELGLDLTRIPGSGNGGRITRDDIRSYIQHLQAATATASVSTSDPAAKKKQVSVDFSKWGSVDKKKITKLRQTIADAMTNSWTTIPHVTQFDDISIDAVSKLISKHKDDYKSQGGRLTLTAVIIKAIVSVLKDFPDFNASIDQNTGEIIYKNYYHIGIAVDTEHGLMVPVLKDADQKSLFDISAELSELAQKTRDRKLAIEDMQGGTFTISNQGGIGGRHFTPIINSPEVAILGLGRGFNSVVMNGEKAETQSIMPIGLSYDHRLIDGGKAARFVVAFAEVLNNLKDKDIALAKKPKK